MTKVLLLLTLFFAFVTNNCNEKPGEGEIAKKGYATAAPVLEALEKYKKDNQNYPDTWIKLVPKYINELPKDGDGIDYSYSYLEDKKTFSVSFSYNSSGVMGVNKCTFYSESKQWSCSGKI